MTNINELFNLQTKENGTIAVSGRELHKGLEINTRYNDWTERMLKYGFEQNIDYIIKSEKVHAQKRVRTYEQVDHIMTLDMAKEIAMIQRSEIGRKIRKYFIEIEKQQNKPKQLSTAEQIKLIAQGNSELNEKIEDVQKEVTNIKENTKLEQGEYSAVTIAVNNKVAQTRSQLGINKNDKQANRELFRDINREIKRVANVSTRSQIRQKDFENVMEIIRLWQPAQSTVFLIRNN